MPKKTTSLTREQVIVRIEHKWTNKFDFSKMKYVDTCTKMDLVCKDCGEITSISLNSILHRKIPCHPCVGKSPKKEWNIKDIRSWTKENRSDYKIISMFRKNTTDNRKGELTIHVKCSNLTHKSYDVNWHSFKSGRSCHLCSKGRRWTLEAITDIFREHDLEIIPTTSMINSYTYTDVSTKEGYLVKTTPKALLIGITPCILTKNPHAIHNIKLWTKIHRPDYRLLSSIYSGDINNNLQWEYLGKGLPSGSSRSFNMALAKFMHNRLKHPDLFTGGSRGETRIKTYLEAHKVTYKREYRFKGCRDKNTLPFDFIVFDQENSLKFLIEYDGAGHYKPIQRGSETKEKAEKAFKVTQLHDKIKNNYCKEHDIPLIRIPYWEFDNIEKVLEDYLETGASEFLSK